MKTNEHLTIDDWVKIAKKYYEPYDYDLNKKKIKQPKKEIQRVNDTGIAFVERELSYSNPKYPFRWVYFIQKGRKPKYKSSIDLNKLEKKIKDAGLPWIIVNEHKAMESYKFNEKYHPSRKPSWF